MTFPVYVAIPVYNGARTIRRTINNVLEQTFGDFRLIVYDDASTDQTAQILSQFEKRDGRVQVLHGTENLGRGGARNRLLAAASDGLIAWQDADDTWAATKLAEQMAFFESLRERSVDPSRAVIISTFCQISKRRNNVKTTIHVPPERYDADYVFSDDYPKCSFQLQATFGLSSAYLACGGFDDDLNWSEDIDMALRLLSGGGEIVSHRSEHALANYHQSLTTVKGDLVARAQQVLIEKHRQFARTHGVDIDALFSKRKLNYLFSIYLANNNFAKAIATTLNSVVDVEEEKMMMVARNLVAVFRAMSASRPADSGES